MKNSKILSVYSYFLFMVRLTSVYGEYQLWYAGLLGQVSTSQRQAWGMDEDGSFRCTFAYSPFKDLSLGRIGKDRNIPNQSFSGIPPHYGLAINALVMNGGEKEYNQYFAIKMDGVEIYRHIYSSDYGLNNFNCEDRPYTEFKQNGRPQWMNYKNPTHSASSFILSFQNNMDEPISNEYYLMKNFRIFIEECHESCLTCNGPLKTNCLTCPESVAPVAGTCSCPTNQYLSNHLCLTSCPSNYSFNSATGACQERCIAQTNCVTCADTFKCQSSSCGAFTQNLQGKCIASCPIYSFQSSGNCIQYDQDLSWSKFGRLQLYDQALTGVYFEDSDITSQFTVFRDMITNPEYQWSKYFYCNGQRLAGGPQGMGKGYVEISYTNLPPHINAKIVFRLYAIGSFDAPVDALFVQVDDVVQASHYHSASLGTPICFISSWTDNFFSSVIDLGSHTSSSMQVNLECHTDQPSQDQSMGYRDYYLILDLCPQDCAVCTSTTCTTCSTGFYKYGTTQCLSVCPSGYYKKDPGQICEVCNAKYTGCSTCDQSKCLSCLTLYLTPTNTCAADCAANTLKNTSTRVCTLCSTLYPNCETCTNSICSTCNANYFMNSSGNCVTDCGVGQFGESTPTRTCRDCNAFCITCTTSANNCQACADIRVNPPACTCPNYYFSLVGNAVCQPCFSNCEICTQTVCTTCQTGFYKHGNTQCLLNCPSGYYKQDLDMVCEICSAKYADCSTCDSTQCFSCTSLFLSPTFTCESNCPLNMWQNSNTQECALCIQQHDNCYSCTELVCSLCEQNFFQNSSGNCVPDCGDGYFKESTTVPTRLCKQCNNICQTCSANALDCISCADLRIDPPACKCPQGFYSVSGQSGCQPCDYKCKTCQNANSCQTCAGNRTGSTCSCPDQYFEPFIQNYLCSRCHDSCLTCIGSSSNQCQTCDTSSNSIYKYQLDSQCLQNCPSNNYYPDSSDYTCQPCDATCLRCDGSSDSDCTACSTSRFLAGSICMTSCPSSGYFSDSILRQCISCITNCNKCTNTEVCQECAVSKFILNGICVDDCPSTGYFKYLPNTICLKCHETCKTCTDSTSTSCISCPSNLYLTQDQQCVAVCESLYFQNEVTKKCETCPNNCSQCSTSTLCTLCSPGYYLYPDYFDSKTVLCYSTCPRGAIQLVSEKTCQSCRFNNQVLFLGRCVDPPCPLYYFNDIINYQCFPCHQTCVDCSGPEPTQCNSCQEGYFFEENGLISQCVYLCSDGFYPDVVKGICQPCTSNCQNCSYEQCLICQKGYYKDTEGLCESNCIQGFYGDDKLRSCAPCHPTCLTCNSGTRNDCASCPTGLYLLQTSCIPSCPNGYFNEETLNTCSRCHPTCYTCKGSNSNDCLNCSSQLYLDQGSCVKTCATLRTFPNSEKYECESCHDSCQSCFGPSSYHCASCRAGSNQLLVDNSFCGDTCPLGTFSNGTECQNCYFTCLTCFGLLINKCSTCIQDFFLDSVAQTCNRLCPSNFQPNFITGVCDPVTECTENQIFNSVQGKCQNCDSKCRTCSGTQPNQCLSCISPQFLNIPLKTCVSVCDDGYYGDSSLGICSKCSPKCSQCSGSKNSCTECKVPQRLLSNDCQCPQGSVIDQSDGTCPKCLFPCSYCSVFDYNCISCASNRSNEIPLCPCSEGYFSIDGLSTCEECDFKCETCYGNSGNCLKCQGDRVGDSCICPVGTYDDGVTVTCRPCDFKCQTCSTASNQCTKCLSDRQIQLDCACPQGSYDDQIQFNCVKCKNKCTSCFKQRDQCTDCRGDRLNPPKCSCPDGYYDDEVSPNCQLCDITCSKCDAFGCLKCAGNRIGPFLTQCICPPDERGISRLSIGNHLCTTCTLGVTESIFSNNLSEIHISIGGSMILQDTDLEETSTLCKAIFKPEFLSKVGYPYCSCQVKEGNLVIKLGRISTVREGDLVEFLDSTPSLSLEGCTNEIGSPILLTRLLSSTISLPLLKNIGVPEITISRIPESLSLCQSLSIEINDFQNTGQRFPQDIKWQLVSSNPVDLNIETKLKSILEKASNESATKIKIQNLFLAPFTTYEFSITFSNFADIQGTNSVILQTSSTQSIEINIDSNLQKSFFTRNKIKSTALIEHLNCASGIVIKVEDEIGVQWNYVNGTKNLENPLSVTKSDTKNPLDFSVDWELASFTFPVESEHYLQIEASAVENPSVKAQFIWKIIITTAKLTTTIQGGNRNAGHSSIIQFVGKSLDLDVPDDKQTEFKIKLNWNCSSVNNNEPCQNMEGILIPLSDTEEFIIGKQQLEPYQAYIIQLIGTAISAIPVKISSAQITLIVTELDLPVLEVGIPDYITNRQINLNQQLIISLQYPDADPDKLFYSAAFIYKLDAVSSIVFEYLDFSFRIWDSFTDFAIDNNFIIIRCSVYNPLYIMPSQSSIQIEVNLPPRKCKFFVNNLSAQDTDLTQIVALETLIRLRVSDCEDNDQPLSYRFGYYFNEALEKQDIKNSMSRLNLNYLTDFTLDQYFDTLIIPSAKSTQGNSIIPIIISAQVKDSLGGIKNISLPLNVTEIPPTLIQDESKIFEMVESLQTNLNNEPSQLCVIANALSNFQTDDFNEVDNFIISRLNYHLKQNPNEVWKEQITKTLAIINKKQNIIKLRGQNVTLYDQMYSSINSFINQELSLASQSNSIEQLLKKNDIQQSPVSDHLTNNMMQGLNTISSLMESSTDSLIKNLGLKDLQSDGEKSTNSEIAKRNNDLLETMKQIDSLLQRDVLPNEGEKQFVGESFSLHSQVLTSQKLLQFLSPSDAFQLIGQEDSNGQKIPNSGLEFGIHGLSLDSFKKNPFATDLSFHYTNSSFQVYNLSLFPISNSFVTINNSRLLQTIQKNTSLSSQNSSINYPEPTFFFQNDQQENSNNISNVSNTSDSGNGTSAEKNEFVCIQKQLSINKNGNWSGDNCTSTVINDQNGNQKGNSCKCKQDGAVTVVNDVQNLFKNSQVQKAFDLNSISKLADWKFWEEPLFYLVTTITTVYICTLFWGKQADDNDQRVSPIVNRKSSQYLKDIKIINNNYNNQDMVIEQIEKDQNFETEQEKNVVVDEFLNEIQQGKKSYGSFENSNRESKTMINSNRHIPISNDLDYQPIQSPNMKGEMTPKLNSDQKNALSFTQTAIIKVFKLEHTYLSIFFTFNDQESRPRRFTLEFIQLIIYLDIMMGFSKSSIIQTVALCIFSAIITQIFVSLIGNLLSNKSLLQLSAGIIISFCLCGVGIWIIFVMLAVSDSDDVRETFYKFLSQIFNDYLIIDSIKCFLRLAALIYRSQNSNSTSAIAQILFLFYQATLQGELSQIFQ